MISQLVDRLDTLDAEGVVASAGLRAGVPGPPAIFTPAHFQTLMSLEGDVGARVMLRGARTVLVPDECLRDLDSREDFVAKPPRR
jgi:CTP:molybdopterin cytidylyltransferase MocA